MATPPGVRARVLQLDAAGENYNQIARVTGLANSTVARICRKFREELDRRPPKNLGSMVVHPVTSITVWCDDCGANIHPPCLACHVNRILAAKKIKQ